MPNIVYKNTPGVSPLIAGGTPTNETIEENWCYPTPTGVQSLEVLNGHLDSVNIEAGQKFGNEHIQLRSVSTGKMVGATANADYFADVFLGDEQNSTDAEIAKKMIPVPGLGVRFYVPNDNSVCILQWNFNQINDGKNDTYQSKNYPTFALFIDGTFDPVNIRRMVGGRNYLLASNIDRIKYTLGRHWSGHKHTTLNKGWHTAEIRLFHPASENEGIVYQTRVRTRGIRYIVFR